MIKPVGLEKGKSVATPGVEKDVAVDKALTPTEATLYRSMTVMINYLAQDSPDIQYAGKASPWDVSTYRRALAEAQETGTIPLRQAQDW